jgi:hypothetical protein
VLGDARRDPPGGGRRAAGLDPLGGVAAGERDGEDNRERASRSQSSYADG